MDTSSEDRARTSQPAGHNWVEEQAPVEQGRWGTETIVRDNELTGKAEAHNASSELVKDDSRGRTVRTRDCGQSRNVLHGRGRPAGATDPLKNPIRGRALGRWVNRRLFHPAVIRGFEVGTTTNVGTTEGENGSGRGMSAGTQSS